MKSMLFAIVMVASVFAQAALLSFEAGPQQNNGVVLNKSAAVNDAQGKPTAMKMDLLGAGLRTKTVLIVEAKVYVAQLFSDNKAGYSRDAGALTSLVNNSNRIALRIDMLRTVSASALSVSFKEALQANGYAIDAELTNMLASIEKAAEATSGKSIVMYMAKNAGKTNLYYQDTTGAVISFVGSPQLMTKIMSIWLGTPADSGLKNLKDQLLKAVY